MEGSSLWPVMGRDGLLGYVDPKAVQESGGDTISIQLTNGRRMTAPREALSQQNGSYYLPVSGREIQAAEPSSSKAAAPTDSLQPATAREPVVEKPQSSTQTARPEFVLPDTPVPPTRRAQQEQALVVPVVEERLDVDRHKIETGGVRVTKEVHERREVVDEPTVRDVVAVERIAVNRAIDAAPEIREEDNVVIIPVVEEMLVVEKRLVLREEVRITRSRVVTREPQTVTLHREEAHVQRWEEGDNGAETVEEERRTRSTRAAS